ncbi:IclR family transcriptional regulator [Microvirga aerophila]|uniref:Transcriptional regulator n=1 Tax=Microvirga aerophila TaxID=670291 RepID=A0A512BZY0_9HYPH|nr:IclR family transcriptional regulator [Microvirga aerophila]GEO17508.1 transcriptional regulator [Microvirga aerophila]
MTGIRDRALAILELLAQSSSDLLLIEISDRLDIPRGATHRVLADLKGGGYVRQDREGGPYRLTAKIVALGFAFLSKNGVTDVAQPILDNLAHRTGELVRLAIIDGDRLTWVAKAQGAQRGLRYDPDDGAEVYLAAAANGHAWMSCLSDEKALELVAKQGFGRDGFGPNAPRTVQDLLQRVHRTRERGYATVVDAYEAGTSAVAAAICSPRTNEPIGTISIAGPSVRMTEARMDEIAPLLRASATELSFTSSGSPLFSAAHPARRHERVAQAG